MGGGDDRVDPPGAATHVHHDVVNFVIAVEVVIEQQVAGLERGERHVDHGGVLDSVVRGMATPA